MTAEAVLEKVVLLPKIKRGVELRRQIGPDFRRLGGGDAVQLRDFLERRLVKGAPRRPAPVAIAPEIALAEILDPDEAFRRVVEENFRRAHTVCREELRD